MYSIHGHGRMIADKVRTDAYARALRREVRRGAVVLDIGSGTGIMSFIACRAGARRVYAVEPGDVIRLAEEIARDNGYADRVEFIRGLSTNVTLPERADVIVSDIRGVLPMCGHSLTSSIDARERLLAPGGALIPKYDRLWGAIVESPELYRDIVGPWEDNGYDLDMSAARRLVTNTWRKARVSPEQLLTEPQCWAVLDYRALANPHVGADLGWEVVREGTANGLGFWFDSCLAEGIHLSNAPGEAELLYGQAFFPLSAPVRLGRGDTVSANISANLVGDDYVWSWSTRVLSRGEVKADFRQSTFFADIPSPERLRKVSATHTPSLNVEGQVEQFILSMMDGKNSLREIALRASERFPDHFAGPRDALSEVSELSLKYGL